MKFTTKFAIIFAAAAAFFAAAETFGSPRQNGRIAFVSLRDNNNEIYVMNADGTSQIRLTNNTLLDQTPVWHPSGRTIAFSRQQNGVWSIWLMNADGSNQRAVPNSQTNLTAGLTWSPDGQQIAFSNGTDIETIRADGTGRTNLMPGNNPPATHPAWSPDGGSIAFARPGGGAYSNIFGIGTSNGNVYQISQAYTYTVPNSPNWSPSGEKLIYAGASQDLSNNESIRVIDFDSGLDRTLYVNVYEGDVSSPKWSPDESHVVFSTAGHVFTVRPDGSDLRPLTVGPHINSEPDWQPLPNATASDFDGDGRADLSVWRPSSGIWYQSQTAAGSRAMTWGVASDKLAPADYDGDGRTDIAVWRPANGTWYLVLSSSGTFITQSWGEAGDIPAPGDFDGDGKAELSVFRPSTGIWYRIQSSNGHFVAVPYGQDGDQPVVGDYDADGRADLAVYRPSNGDWYVQRTTAGYIVVHLGSSTSVPAPADYDGDGRTDVSVLTPFLWYVRYSTTGQVFILDEDTFEIGDIPVSADYDGDGLDNFAIFRPSTATWHILSTQGMSQTQFGEAGDKPTVVLSFAGNP